MKVWILLILAILLLLWGAKERFVTTPEGSSGGTQPRPITEVAPGAAPEGSTGGTEPLPVTSQGSSGGSSSGGTQPRPITEAADTTLPMSTSAPVTSDTTSSDRRKQVFGPLFMGVGSSVGASGVDSTKTNVYPELMGGHGSDRGLKEIESNELRRPTLPFSIQPGDMELIPDPYRVSQQFSAASYSSKTEPVPFLTDFSAFQT